MLLKKSWIERGRDKNLMEQNPENRVDVEYPPNRTPEESFLWCMISDDVKQMWIRNFNNLLKNYLQNNCSLNLSVLYVALMYVYGQ